MRKNPQPLHPLPQPLPFGSSSKSYKYDVFLSFRGEDTRRNIVSHLYAALQRRGIRTFKDDERLEMGKQISNELLKAIEEARFAIVIFSKSYASSRWCLEELAHIIKCKNELEQIVIPVFHDVSPTDVRHQNPPFADSFSQHEEKYKDDMEKVQRWRDAFVEAGKISGYHLPNFKDEAECIKKLVDDIFPKLLQIISPLPENLVGMESQVEKVTSLLDMGSNDVRSIGIWGMGGIGKTKIATVLHQRYYHQFEADCFLGDVGKLHQKNGLTWLQEKIICKLLGEGMTLTSEYEGMNILKNMLRSKKILLTLDDVNHHEQLESLVGGLEWFGMGSRIILTARDKHLLISHVGENMYEVQLLSEDEALELFSTHAFKEKSPKEDFMKLSRKVVEHAGGLPLALKVLGSLFYGRDKEHWRHMLDRLKRIPPKDILGKLKLSFDGLDKDEKELFLDIVFLDVACLDRINFRYCFEQLHRDASHGFLIDILIEKSLLSIDIPNSIVMHNMIREMSENVIQEEYTNSRIWLPEEVCDLFKGKLITEKVESLRIPKNYSFENDVVNDSNIFKRMQSLKILIIGNGTFSSNCITYLPSSLRLIEWEGYPSSSLPESFEPSQLAVLSLHKSCLVELWPISKKLSNLKHLDLQDNCKLAKTPHFGDMPNLERLDLSGCVNLEEVHPSLGHCRMLTKLRLYGCRKLKKLPKFVCMESLEYLNLLKCTSLQEFPEICGDMHCLSALLLGSPWIRSSPASLSSLRYLELIDCEDLESISGTYRNLGYLLISGCNKLATLPNSLFESQQLDIIRIERCSGRIELPISLGVQKNLSSLYIRGCENLKKLPSFIQMESLRQLDLQFCQNLNELPGELPPNLTEVRVDYHLALKGIRDLVICCLNLHELKIYGAVSSEQVNVFLDHFRRTCIQCDFNQRAYFVISFFGVKIPELFDHHFINQKEISIDLNPSWYTNKFMGFWISCGPTKLNVGLEATLLCKSDPERKYSLKYDKIHFRPLSLLPFVDPPSICFFYIPFERLWDASGNKKGKNPNDYYMLELSQQFPYENRVQACWGVRLEYEKEAMTDIGHQKKRRKQ